MFCCPGSRSIPRRRITTRSSKPECTGSMVFAGRASDPSWNWTEQDLSRQGGRTVTARRTLSLVTVGISHERDAGRQDHLYQRRLARNWSRRCAARSPRWRQYCNRGQDVGAASLTARDDRHGSATDRESRRTSSTARLYIREEEQVEAAVAA